MSKYDDNFLVDYIDKRIKVFSKKENAAEVYSLLYNNCRKAKIEYDDMPHWGCRKIISFYVDFYQTDTDELIKIAERVHNEYRRICGYQNRGAK